MAQLCSYISPQLADLIDQMMAAKASQRPANTQVILERLQEIDRELYQPEYAVFWRRFAAYLLDMVILGISGFVLGCVLGIPLILVDIFSYLEEAFLVIGTLTVLGTVGGFFGLLVFHIWMISSYGWEEGMIIIVIYGILYVVLQWLYFTLLESSTLRGTFGKRIMGLAVTDLKSDRISFDRANGRFWGKNISAIIIVGFVMAEETTKKQALHDMIARCLVVKEP